MARSAGGSEAADRYRALMDELLRLRALGGLTEDEEERFAVALNDSRRVMTEEEREAIERLYADRAVSGERG